MPQEENNADCILSIEGALPHLVVLHHFISHTYYLSSEMKKIVENTETQTSLCRKRHLVS